MHGPIILARHRLQVGCMIIFLKKKHINNIILGKNKKLTGYLGYKLSHQNQLYKWFRKKLGSIKTLGWWATHQTKPGFITREFTTIPLQRFLESSQASSFPSTHGQKPFKTYHSVLVYPFSSEAPKKTKSFSIAWLVSLDFPLSLVNFSYR